MADYAETWKFLSYVWRDYYEGKCTIKDVLAEYDKHGFQVNQDLPGNGCWEEMYLNTPDAKVILTVRDSDDVWFKGTEYMLI